MALPVDRAGPLQLAASVLSGRLHEANSLCPAGLDRGRLGPRHRFEDGQIAAVPKSIERSLPEAGCSKLARQQGRGRSMPCRRTIGVDDRDPTTWLQILVEMPQQAERVRNLVVHVHHQRDVDALRCKVRVAGIPEHKPDVSMAL